MNKRVHLYISGRVQGVFFRDSTRQMAQAMGLTGYVMNLPDDRVEVVVEGREEQVDRLIQWCHIGPPGAIVTSVDIHDEPHKGEFRIFEVKR